MTALGIMARYPQVRSVACLMGSGYFMTLAQTLFPPLVMNGEVSKVEFDKLMAPLAPYDISHRLEQLGDRPLLLWHGEDDDVVPATETRRLQQALIANKLDGQLTCLWESGVKHRITPLAIEATSDFFACHL